ncbi:hypothetical protein Pd630_LPD01942 [Rhodococcus opacus PD630]|nr:hypothetical protein Pd630_LPD01942 [Rhodococcus opacus PD630]
MGSIPQKHPLVSADMELVASSSCDGLKTRSTRGEMGPVPCFGRNWGVTR